VKDYLIGGSDRPGTPGGERRRESDLADPGDPNNGINRRVVITNIGS
jgi:hypothetical protein